MIAIKNHRLTFPLRFLDLFFLIGIVFVLWINFFASVEASEKSDSLKLPSETVADESMKECLICKRDEVQGYQLKCGHSYCESCILCWARINLSCPICRFDLSNDQNLQALLKIVEQDYRNIAIHDACRLGIFDVINYHIENGIDLISFGSYGQTPLQLAFLSGRRDVVEFLIENGADINDLDINGKNYFTMNAVRGTWTMLNISYLKVPI